MLACFFAFAGLLTNFSKFTSWAKMAASLLSGFIKALNLLIGYLDTESMIALVVGKFKPFGYYALNCMFGLINSFPSAHRNFKQVQEEISLPVTGGPFWLKTYAL